MVKSRWASLQELETWWSIDDVGNANDALDAFEQAEYEATKRGGK